MPWEHGLQEFKVMIKKDEIFKIGIFNKPHGVKGCLLYTSYDVPSAFDGFRIGFASDFHYESRFTRKRLDNAIRALQSLNADVLLLGGDYGSPKGGDMDTLFTALGKVLTPYGICLLYTS